MPAMTPSSAVVYSGGMDSYTALRDRLGLAGAESVLAVTFDYGQRHAKEVEVAERACRELSVAHRVVQLPLAEILDASALTSTAHVPEGHYAEENMKATVVPNRNMILLSVAVGVAVNEGAKEVVCGAHAGDHAIYPDCRPEFFEAVNLVAGVANYEPVRISTPFLYLTKGEILAYARDNLDMTAEDYRHTWTCYNGRELACGRCGSCVERLEAFDSVSWDDPLEYEDRDFWRIAQA